uniref:AAA+ ATPase domain-containing protein n=1 Tax=viral metagenome TaxID=1070528 RepID=A0A6C0DI57_9ZZZZ
MWIHICLFFLFVSNTQSFTFVKTNNGKYPISRPHYENTRTNKDKPQYGDRSLNRTTLIRPERKYPLSRNYQEGYIRRLNSNNQTEQDFKILGEEEENPDIDEDVIENLITKLLEKDTNYTDDGNPINTQKKQGGIRIIMNKEMFSQFMNNGDNDDEDNEPFGGRSKNRDKKSDNFEVITKFPYNFTDIGGFDKIKNELSQCIDFLTNYAKYSKYNVRVPKGLILEGPPGNGKTLLAKGLAGEAKVGFIAVSGSEFQEKYVGVGSSRVRELFTLAKKNAPCIIFIDEIDAIGRKRSGDGETSTSERDSTLNELLVSLDGFKNSTGIFLICATNRADLLDPALTRPGRIDKRIFVGLPDSNTREAILNIHTKGKPHDASVNIKDLVDITLGLSAAQIENLLNEAMLNALRNNRDTMTNTDIDIIMNRMMAGWQPTDHQFTSDIIDHIVIHEMGHAIVGMLSKHHSKMTKVVINLSSPKSPGYTIFEGSTSTIYTREALFEHLSILLAGRIAEEVFYDVSVTTGAINDFEEAFKLAEKMIVYYGMGKKIIYPNLSETYKEKIDNEVFNLINDAYAYAEFIVKNSKDLIHESAQILKREKILTAETLIELMMKDKYKNIFDLKYSQ